MTPADRLAAFEDFLREELSLPRFREAQAHLAGIRASVRVASPTAPDKVARSMEKIAGVMRERDLRPDIAFSEIQDWLTIAGYDVPLRSCALKCPHGEGTNCAACVRAVCSPTAPDLRDALEQSLAVLRRIHEWAAHEAPGWTHMLDTACGEINVALARAALQERPTVAPKEPGHAD